LQCSDEEVVTQIKENPYLQHFVGMNKWSNEAPFDSSLMVWFRKRLSAKVLNEINEEMCRRESQPEEEETDDSDDGNDDPHGGTLIVDATCAPSDISYPTDTSLLAEAIEKSDGLIDKLHEEHKGVRPRPRTYREKSRNVFTAFIKRRKPSSKHIRATIRSQLGFLKRNLKFIESMQKEGLKLPSQEARLLETIQTLYEQQSYMFTQRVHSVENRIVSITQPHVRPIPRGKANAKTEFGAKLAISVVNGYAYADHMSYNNFNEGVLLPDALEHYKRRFGMYPSRILADAIYRNKSNRELCKKLNIKLSGLPLGRRSATKYRQQLKDYREDCGQRNEIEGKIGTAKTHYGMNRIRARLPESGLSVIVMSLMTMNLSKLAKAFLRFFLFEFRRETIFAVS
jgi:hypothetical protein